MKVPYIRFPSTSRSLKDLKMIEPKAREVYRKYLDELDGANVSWPFTAGLAG